MGNQKASPANCSCFFDNYAPIVFPFPMMLAFMSFKKLADFFVFSHFSKPSFQFVVFEGFLEHLKTCMLVDLALVWDFLPTF